MVKTDKKGGDLKSKNKRLATIFGIIAGSVYLFFFLYQHLI
tara:strand:+ start:2100 stop:2222 length:123 start_codon:yes stop_codon:yes gene_type:complete